MFHPENKSLFSQLVPERYFPQNRKCHSKAYKTYTLSVPNIRNTFLILCCSPFCPQNSLNSSEHGLHKVSKAFHRDAGTCWLQCFPQLAGCPFGSGPFLIHTEYCWVLKIPAAALHFLTFSSQCTWHLLPYPIQRHLNLLSCPFTLWMAHIHNPGLTCLKA